MTLVSLLTYKIKSKYWPDARDWETEALVSHFYKKKTLISQAELWSQVK